MGIITSRVQIVKIVISQHIEGSANMKKKHYQVIFKVISGVCIEPSTKKKKDVLM